MTFPKEMAAKETSQRKEKDCFRADKSHNARKRAYKTCKLSMIKDRKRVLKTLETLL